MALLFLTALAGSPALAAPDLSGVDEIIEKARRGDAVPGIAVSIVADGAVVYAKGFGTAGRGLPTTPDTPFALGSMSKSFTALAVLQQVRAGRLELDAPVQRYLPDFRPGTGDEAARILVRHLLWHTGGLPGQVPWPTGPDPTFADHVTALDGVRLVDAPGATHHYGAPSYQVLARLVEVVTGEPFDVYQRERVLAPLGMHHSHVDRAAAKRDGLASGHQYWLGLAVPSLVRWREDRLPSASMIASAGDLGSYLAALLRGHAAIPPELTAAWRAPGAPGEGFDYTFGWRTSHDVHGRLVHHGGMLPDYRGKLILRPDEGLAIAVLTNASAMWGTATSHVLANDLDAVLHGEAPSPPHTPVGWLNGAAGLGMLLLLVRELRQAWALRTEGAATARKVLGSLAVPPVVTLGVPALFGLPWTAIFEAEPDVAVFTLVILGVGFASGLVRLRRWLGARRVGRRAVETQ